MSDFDRSKRENAARTPSDTEPTEREREWDVAEPYDVKWNHGNGRAEDATVRDVGSTEEPEHGERPGVGERAPVEEPDAASTGPSANLLSLSENPVTLEDASADVRGFQVYDRDGENIGKVDDLLVDDDERRVRFLNVKSGGFLGFGGDTHVIPIDAITRVEEDEVHIDQSREHVDGSPAFGTDVNLDARETYEGIYRHYGYTPFWMPGYVYPTDPFTRRR